MAKLTQNHNFRPSIQNSFKYTCKNDIYKENKVYVEFKKLIFLPSTTISTLYSMHSSLKYPSKRDFYKKKKISCLQN